MTVALTMIARNEQGRIGRALDSASGLVDRIAVLDTGSTDNTIEEATRHGAEVTRAEWQGFAAARTRALQLAQDADWILMLDADMTVEAHPDLSAWLAADPDPDVGAWQTQMVDGELAYRLPLLVRGGLDWRYTGATHEYLETGGRKQRPLLGLTVHHHPDGDRVGKHERDLELLGDGVRAGDPRAVYYTAQALWCLGRDQEAADLYERRAHMSGWEEEGWHAAYMAARLRRDVAALMRAHERRPWRPEPLRWAARIVAEDDAHDDVLFLELAA